MGNIDIFNTTIYIVIATVDDETKVIDCFISYGEAMKLVNYLNENKDCAAECINSTVTKQYDTDFYKDII